MPFYVTTDFSGFVYKVNYYQEESPLTGVLIELLNNKDEVIDITASDVDGYYQFSHLTPGNYQIRITPEYLKQSGYTSKTIGYQFSTPSMGGIIELPAMLMKKLPNQKKSAEAILSIDTNTLNNEPTVWLDSDNVNYGKVYSLTSTRNYSTQQKAFEPDSLPDTPATRADLPVKLTYREKFPTQMEIRATLPSTPISRSELPVKPVTRSRLPVQPVTRTILPIEINTNEQTVGIENIRLDDPGLVQPYVIQFIAGKNKANIQAHAASITNVNELFLAEKEIKGEIWYCLISNTFINKDYAQENLESLGLPTNSAWLVDIAEFSNIITLSKQQTTNE